MTVSDPTEANSDRSSAHDDLPLPVSSAEHVILAKVADDLGISRDELAGLGLKLFASWLSGQSRYPTIGQQNHAWYRQLLDAAHKVNPGREELKAWFSLPHGSAQYLSQILFDPTRLPTDEDVRAIAARFAGAVRSASKEGDLGTATATVLLHPADAKHLEDLILAQQRKELMEPPVLVRQLGVVKVSCTMSGGLPLVCRVLGHPSRLPDQAKGANPAPQSCLCGERPAL